MLHGFCRNVIVPRRHDGLGGVFKMFGRVLDHQRHRVGITQRIPDDVQPIRVTKVLGLVLFTDREANGPVHTVLVLVPYKPDGKLGRRGGCTAIRRGSGRVGRIGQVGPIGRIRGMAKGTQRRTGRARKGAPTRRTDGADGAAG